MHPRMVLLFYIGELRLGNWSSLSPSDTSEYRAVIESVCLSFVGALKGGGRKDKKKQFLHYHWVQRNSVLPGGCEQSGSSYKAFTNELSLEKK